MTSYNGVTRSNGCLNITMQQTKLVLQYIAKINELNDISITNILQIKKKKSLEEQ